MNLFYFQNRQSLIEALFEADAELYLIGRQLADYLKASGYRPAHFGNASAVVTLTEWEDLVDFLLCQAEQLGSYQRIVLVTPSELLNGKQFCLVMQLLHGFSVAVFEVDADRIVGGKRIGRSVLRREFDLYQQCQDAA